MLSHYLICARRHAVSALWCAVHTNVKKCFRHIMLYYIVSSDFSTDFYFRGDERPDAISMLYYRVLLFELFSSNVFLFVCMTDYIIHPHMYNSTVQYNSSVGFFRLLKPSKPVAPHLKYNMYTHSCTGEDKLLKFT